MVLPSQSTYHTDQFITYDFGLANQFLVNACTCYYVSPITDPDPYVQ